MESAFNGQWSTSSFPNFCIYVSTEKENLQQDTKLRKKNIPLLLEPIPVSKTA